MSITLITKQALEENKTDGLANEKRRIKDMIKKVETAIKKNKIKATVKLGGSAAKETFIGNDFDVDIFVMFDYDKYLNEDLSELLKKSMKHLKPEIIHGSRDYLLIENKFEIVPVLKITNPEQAVNVTDASPLHATWVRKKLKNKKNLKDEIKLTKMFFKSIGVYGAESYIKGISGHVTDIMVINYGSFKKTIQAISKWRENAEIDIENHKTVLDKAKIQGPLIVVDPIQPNRNAAAAVNEATYEKLKKTAKVFLKKPSIEYFRVKNIDLDKLKKKYNLILKVSPKKGKLDIVGAKLMKGYEFILKGLKEFDIEKSGWKWDKKDNCYCYFKAKSTKLPKTFESKGPSKDYPAHVKRFKQKYKNTTVKKGVIYAKVKRDIIDINEMALYLAKDAYMKEKIGGIKIVN